MEHRAPDNLMLRQTSMIRIPRPPPSPHDPIADSPDTSRFCPISLGDWFELCQRTGVPHVPTERLTTIQSSDWFASIPRANIRTGWPPPSARS